MKRKIYNYGVAAIFIFVFFAKMIISVAPVFFSTSDKEMMSAVIMQIEVSHPQEDDNGDKPFKFTDFKCFEFPPSKMGIEFFASYITLANKQAEPSERFHLPFNPSIPTPPPNLI